MRSRVLSVTAPGRFEFREADTRPPGPGEVEGTTLWSVLSPGTELAVGVDGSRYGFPLDLGYAAVFRVERAGADVDGWSAGDIALSMGPHASHQLRPATELVRIPAGLEAHLAPFARLMHVPLAVLATSRLPIGGRVGISGLGVIGQLAVRCALAAGYSVVAADASPERRALVAAGVPAHEVLPPQCADLVVECTGQESALLDGLAALRDGGELAIAGVPWRPRGEASVHELASMIFHRYLTLRSGWEWQVPWAADDDRATIPVLLDRALGWLARGAVEVGDLAVRIRPDEIPATYRALKERRASRLTALVHWA